MEEPGGVLAQDVRPARSAGGRAAARHGLDSGETRRRDGDPTRV